LLRSRVTFLNVRSIISYESPKQHRVKNYKFLKKAFCCLWYYLVFCTGLWTRIPQGEYVKRNSTPTGADIFSPPFTTSKTGVPSQNYWSHQTVVTQLPSVAQQPTVSLGQLIIEPSRSHSDTPQTVGLVIRTAQRPLPDNTQHLQETDINAPGGIRTRNHCERAAADPRLDREATGLGRQLRISYKSFQMYAGLIKMHIWLAKRGRRKFNTKYFAAGSVS